MTYTYAWGYKSKLAAELALIDSTESGQISIGEFPRVSSYKTRDGRRLYRITLIDTK